MRSTSLRGRSNRTGRSTKVACSSVILTYGSTDGAEIRLFSRAGKLLCSNRVTTNFVPVNGPYFRPRFESGLTYVENGFQSTPACAVEVGTTRLRGNIVYAEPLSNLNETIREVRIYLAGGVLAGTILALLAGLLVAQRAMRPVVELTEAAREIERTRDPSLRIPHPEAEDEVADLARTLESMLGALGAARNESEVALARQREFVADASHELRTPLTSVLANLELLADELDGEQADSAKSALRSTRRMRGWLPIYCCWPVPISVASSSGARPILPGTLPTPPLSSGLGSRIMRSP